MQSTEYRSGTEAHGPVT